MSNSQPENMLLVNKQGRLVSVDYNRGKYLLEETPFFLPSGVELNRPAKKSQNERGYRLPTDEELKEYKAAQKENAAQVKKAIERKEKIKNAVDTLSTEITHANNEAKDIDAKDLDFKDDKDEESDEKITDLVGIGAKLADKLTEAGFGTIEAIKEALGENDDEADLGIVAILGSSTENIRKQL